MMKTTRQSSKLKEFADVLRHEFRHIFHDAGVMLIVVGAILIYATAYSLAYRNEVLREVPVAVVDLSHTASSRQLVRSFDATPNLKVAYKPSSLEEAKELFFARKINGAIVIPSDYEKKLLRNERVNLAVYADASYFLMYRQVFFDVTGSVLHSNSDIEWRRFVSRGAQPEQAQALSNPLSLSVRNMYNPYGGYASFVMPAIILLIIQQTLLIGIGMVGGTWRERKLYKTLIPTGAERMSVIPLVLGKSAAYVSIYALTLLYVLGFHYKLFGYPMNGRPGDIVLFLLPYILSCTFMGIAFSSLFKYRENSLIFLLFTSIPFLMLSGVSLPEQAMPGWLFRFGKIIPSSSGVDGFVRIQTMGATLNEVSVQFRTLWILTGAYFVLACLGMRNVLFRVERKDAQRKGKTADGPADPQPTENIRAL